MDSKIKGVKGWSHTRYERWVGADNRFYAVSPQVT